MNPCQRMLAALAGEPHDGIPVMLHNFMHAAREAGATMEQYRRDPKVVADVLWRSVKTYGFDGILVDIDTALLADAVGVPVEYPEHEPARAHAGCLASLEEVDDLEPVDLANHPRIQVALEGVRLLVQRSGGEILIRGNCDQCPFSLASMMRTPEQWLMDLTEANQHESVDRLLAYCTDVTMQFLRLMAQTGCHMLSNGDSPAGPDMISPAMYRRFALPWERKVVEQAHALGLPYVLHICGNTSAILEDMIASGADGLEIDYKTDPSRAHDAMKDRAAFFGNLDPSDVLANGTPQLVERKTIELLELFADTPRFVLNSGCAIPASAPAENLHAMIRAARAFHS